MYRNVLGVVTKAGEDGSYVISTAHGTLKQRCVISTAHGTLKQRCVISTARGTLKQRCVISTARGTLKRYVIGTAHGTLKQRYVIGTTHGTLKQRYVIGTTHGTLKQRYFRSQFIPSKDTSLHMCDVHDEEVNLREVARSESMGSGQGFRRLFTEKVSLRCHWHEHQYRLYTLLERTHIFSNLRGLIPN